MTKEMTSSFEQKKAIQLKIAETTGFKWRMQHVDDITLKGTHMSRVINGNWKIIPCAMSGDNNPFNPSNTTSTSLPSTMARRLTRWCQLFVLGIPREARRQFVRCDSSVQTAQSCHFLLAACWLARMSGIVCSAPNRNTDIQSVVAWLSSVHNWTRLSWRFSQAVSGNGADMRRPSFLWAVPLCSNKFLL